MSCCCSSCSTKILHNSIVLILAIIASVLLARNITGPILKLTTAAARIAEGDLSHRINIESSDELGLLGQSFGNMVENLEKSRANLKDSEKRTRATFNAISDAVFLHPLLKEGFAPFVDVNDTACKRYGYTREEFLMLTAPDITIKPDANEHSTRGNRKSLMEAGRMIFETTHITKTGTEFPVEINSAIIVLSGRPMILAVVRDTTERKHEEQERKKLEAQLTQAQKMEAIGALAGGIAHDFNNLLQAINGYTQLLLIEKEDDDPEYHSLQAIRNAGFRATELVRQLLLFSRKADSIQRPIELQDEVEQAKKILERTVPKMVEHTWGNHTICPIY